MLIPDIGYFVVAGLMSLIGMYINQKLKSKFRHYSGIGLRSGMNGREVAEAMLRKYGINDVKIVQGEGFLTDHYNPLSKTVSLSPEVYHGRSVVAAAVAAHECGHAVQHNTAYAFLKMRSALVPAVKVASLGSQILLAISFVTLSSFPQLMLITIGLFAVTTIFSLVTLPVEFDASNRAKAWLDASGVVSGKESNGVKDALHWAAMTYVAAALSSLVMLLYLVLRYTSSQD